MISFIVILPVVLFCILFSTYFLIVAIFLFISFCSGVSSLDFLIPSLIASCSSNFLFSFTDSSLPTTPDKNSIRSIEDIFSMSLNFVIFELSTLFFFPSMYFSILLRVSFRVCSTILEFFLSSSLDSKSSNTFLLLLLGLTISDSLSCSLILLNKSPPSITFFDSSNIALASSSDTPIPSLSSTKSLRKISSSSGENVLFFLSSIFFFILSMSFFCFFVVTPLNFSAQRIIPRSVFLRRRVFSKSIFVCLADSASIKPSKNFLRSSEDRLFIFSGLISPLFNLARNLSACSLMRQNGFPIIST